DLENMSRPRVRPPSLASMMSTSSQRFPQSDFHHQHERGRRLACLGIAFMETLCSLSHVGDEPLEAVGALGPDAALVGEPALDEAEPFPVEHAHAHPGRTWWCGSARSSPGSARAS